MTSGKRLLAAILTISIALSASLSEARAGVHDGVNRVAYLTGFNEYYGHNGLTNGREFLLTNTFSGNSIDFGNWSLTLQGPLSVGFSTANRPARGMDFTFGTAASGSANTSTFNYSLEYHAGDTTASASGSLLVDGGVHLDQLGFYSVNLEVSSRQSIGNAGNAVGQTNQYDLDLGPVNVNGNIFVDAFVAITQPLFDASGKTNPFAQLSGLSELRTMIDSRTTDLLTAIQDGAIPAVTTTARGIMPATSVANAYGPTNQRGGHNGTVAVVPEPTVLLLMLAGLPVLWRCRYTRQIA